MKRCLTVALAVVIASLPLLGQKDAKSRADSATGGERAKYAVEYASEETKAADRAFQNGKDQEGSTDLQDVVQYAKLASEASVQSGRRQKETEISLRKIAYQLSQLKNTRPLEQQDEVKHAIEAVEGSRTALLDAMFNKKKRD